MFTDALEDLEEFDLEDDETQQSEQVNVHF